MEQRDDPNPTAGGPTVVVVGGGPAGLAAALTARRAGVAVHLVERRATSGGRARTDAVGGARLNLGPHALAVDGPAHRFLRSVGIDPAGSAPRIEPAQMIDEGGAHRFPAGAIGLLRTGGLPTRTKPAVAALLTRLGRLAARAPSDRSASEVLAEHLSEPSARRFGAALVRLATYADPARISADAAFAQLAGALGPGVRYLDGGWQRWIDRLESLVVDAGVGLHLGEAAEAIVADPTGGWTVLAGHRSFRADAVVLAVAPVVARRLLDDAALWPDLGPASVATVLDLVVRRNAIEHPFVLGLDRPLYASRHDPPASKLAPAGHELLSLMRYGDAGDEIGRFAIEELERFAGWTGIAEVDVVARRSLLRVTTAETVPSPTTGGLPGRPPIEVPGRSGILVCGDWVGPEGLLVDASIASAQRAGAAAAATAREPSVGVGH